MEKKANVLGIVSCACVALGIFVAGLPCSIVAIICAALGFSFNENTEKITPVVGVVLGIIELVVMLIVLTLLQQNGNYLSNY